jgi:hypothetical protein
LFGAALAQGHIKQIGEQKITDLNITSDYAENAMASNGNTNASGKLEAVNGE